jgi:glutaredoxin-like protein
MVSINKESKSRIEEIFAKELEKDVNLMFFTDVQSKCELCNEMKQLLEELSALTKKIKLTVYEIGKNKKEAKFLGIEKAPALVIGGEKLYNLYYYGLPSGYEFPALVDDIIDASHGNTNLSETTKNKLKDIKRITDIKVFVTPTCPYCSKAVRMAHQFSIENLNIKGIMIESNEFPELANRYGVMAVPKIVINDKISFEGSIPEKDFLEQVLKAI